MVDEPLGEQRRLRIAMIHDEPPVGGAIGRAAGPHGLIDTLTRRGHGVDVFTSIDAQGRDFVGYDVIHEYGAVSAPWRARTPIRVRTVHTHPFHDLRAAPKWRERGRLAMRGLAQLWGSATATRTVLSAPETGAAMPWVSTVIPEGVDRTVFAPAAARKHARPTVLFVGTWRGPDRGAELAWLFARTVALRVPDAQLRLVTSDEPVGAPEGVVLLGSLDVADLIEEYRRAWVFCLPSGEGGPEALLQAMSLGLPVVATPAAHALRVTRDGRDGVIVGFAGLPDVLVSLLTSAPARRRMSERAIERARDFDLETIADRYEAIYRRRRRPLPVISALRRMRQD